MIEFRQQLNSLRFMSGKNMEIQGSQNQ